MRWHRNRVCQNWNWIGRHFVIGELIGQCMHWSDSNAILLHNKLVCHDINRHFLIINSVYITCFASVCKDNRHFDNVVSIIHMSDYVAFLRLFDVIHILNSFEYYFEQILFGTCFQASKGKTLFIWRSSATNTCRLQSVSMKSFPSQYNRRGPIEKVMVYFPRPLLLYRLIIISHTRTGIIKNP